MKLKNIKDVEGFFHVIDQCTGRVELISSEGDRINLKSRLTQYMAMASILNTDYIDELGLVVSSPEDMERILRFLCVGI